MWIRTEALHTGKRGNKESEYEDAFFPRSTARELSTFRCAVADGASESAFSGLWAKLLVTSFGRHRMHIAHLKELWQRAVTGGGGAADAGNGNGKQLPWYLQNKVTNGAHAAFVGMSIRDARALGQSIMPNGTGAEQAAAPDKKKTKGLAWNTTPEEAAASVAGTWRVIAVGDSCVFQIRDNKLLLVGPIDKSERFDNSPFLIASKTTKSLTRNDENVSVMTGTWMPGDVFYLATDAMAQWMLAEHEKGRPQWPLLRALGSETFAPLVTKLREECGLHNDDTTLLRIEVA